MPPACFSPAGRPSGARAGPPPLSETGQKAYELVNKSDYAGAITLLESVHKQGGLNAVEQSLLGTLYIEMGRPGDAAEVLAPSVTCCAP